MDCRLRGVALDFAGKLLEGATRKEAWMPLVFDGLGLSPLCNKSYPARHAAGKPVPRAHGLTDEPTTFVDASRGNDDSGDGSERNPFRTLKRGLSAAASATVPGTVFLREGSYYLGGSPALIGRNLSGVTIAGEGAGRTSISGGVPLNLSWSAESAQQGVYVAEIPKGALYGLDVGGLFVDGRREIRARWPNGDPETTGLYKCNDSETGWVPGADKWDSKSPKPRTPQTNYGNSSWPARWGPDWTTYKMSFDGLCERYDPPMSFWGGTGRPTRLTYKKSIEPWNKTFAWANFTTGILHAFHGGHWGGWQFRIVGHDAGAGTIDLDPWGGQQEARGRSSGAEWYVDNLREELDSPREWFYDAGERKLYYMPAKDADGPPDAVVLAVLQSIIRVEGSQEKPVQDVTFVNLTLTQSSPTFMEAYEVPSGGDWSIHRGGALFVEGAERVSVENCSLARLGGNAVFFSDYVRNVSVSGNEFAWIGDSAVAAVGSTKWKLTGSRDTDLMDVTSGNQPRGISLTGNFIHDIGIFGKQTSAFFAALAGPNYLGGNVMFNGPRAGVNINDGFLGGNLLENNLLFNWVRETSDHGNFNSWDRMPVITGLGPNGTAIAENRIRGCMMWNNFNSRWPIDHDDGSQFYNDTKNVLLYGGAKNFLGHSKISTDNLYYQRGNSFCAESDSGGANDVYSRNRCVVSTSNQLYRYSKCSPDNINATVDLTSYNTYFSGDAKDVYVPCGDEKYSFKDWQEKGYDKGSTLNPLPENKEFEEWARKMLGV